MAIRQVNDLGGLGRLAQTLLQRRALEQQDQRDALTRRVQESQLALQGREQAFTQSERERLANERLQRANVEQAKLDLLAGAADFGSAAPLAGVAPGALSSMPGATLEDLTGVLKAADPTRGQRGPKFSKGTEFFVTIDGAQKLVVPTLNDATGETELVVKDIPTGAEVAKRSGLTAAEEAALEVTTAGEKETVVQDIKTEKEPERAKLTKLEEDAAKASGEAIDRIAKIKTNIQNYDNAIKAIQQGARTGTITKMFPDFATATIELRNAQAQLGLDVIGSVTFGALSEGEKELALSSALPTDLEGPELIAWIERKKAAQIKAMNILGEAATFLSQPGNTRAMWNARNAQQQAQAAPVQAVPQAVTPAQPAQQQPVSTGIKVRRIR